MSQINQQQLHKVLSYIDSYWDKIILRPSQHKTRSKILDSVIMQVLPKDEPNPHILEVPYAALVPNDSKYRYIFYWDSYFMFQGLLGTSREWVIPSMVANFIYLFKKYHIIPNFSHPESLGRSQPPLLTSMIFDAYEVLQHDTRLSTKIRSLIRSKKHWLKKAIDSAKQEYTDVWLSPMHVDHKHYNHLVTEYQLNRYGNRDVGYAQPSEQESGWDMTSRFYNRCDEFLPVDLNCFLYKYELDFAKAAGMLGNTQEEAHWQAVAEDRKKRMQLFWNDEKGFFYDYDYHHNKQSVFTCLAGFVPLWAGLATPEQAARMVAHLKDFETHTGLMVATKDTVPPLLDLSHIPEPLQMSIRDIVKPKQWDYPNIWPPLEYLAVVGLLKYGYTNDAIRIIKKSLAAHIQVFEKYHSLLEKMDGLTGDMPKTYWYPTQLGFGWTNAIFARYAQILQDFEARRP